jgi:16S rRNA processing protein RimM
MPVLVTVGRIGRAHGIRGEVSVEVRTDSPDVRFAVGARLTTLPERAEPLTVRQTRWHSGRLLMRFEGVVDRSGAEALRGILLLTHVSPDERPADPDEFFDHQLVGLRAVTTQGDEVGEVAEVLHFPAQDLLVILRNGSGEVLVPFVAELVPDIDLRGRRVVIAPPPGLLDPGVDEAES